jgi:hypothetical protein
MKKYPVVILCVVVFFIGIFTLFELNKFLKQPDYTSINQRNTVLAQTKSRAQLENQKNPPANPTYTHEVPTVSNSVMNFVKDYFGTTSDPQISGYVAEPSLIRLTFPSIGEMVFQSDLDLGYFSKSSDTQPCTTTYKYACFWN